MKRFSFHTMLSAVVVTGVLIAASSLPATVRAECYQMVGGGDAIIVPCPNNDPGSEDSDGDGIINRDDNCPSVYNPDQLDTWGNGAGNACEETDIGIGSGGALAFPQHDGTYDVYGDCYLDAFSNVQCHQMARLSVCKLPGTVGTSVYVTNPSSGAGSTQRVLVTLLERRSQYRVYQLNIQDSQGFNLGSAFTITYQNFDCPDNDGFIGFDDYCPNVAGRYEGCPTHHEYVNAYQIREAAWGPNYERDYCRRNPDSDWC